MPSACGNDLSAYGNDMSQASLVYPIGSERAAIVAAKATGALVATVPVLTLYVGIVVGTTGSSVKHDALSLAASTQVDVDTVRRDTLIVLRRRPNMPLKYDRVFVSH